MGNVDLKCAAVLARPSPRWLLPQERRTRFAKDNWFRSQSSRAKRTNPCPESAPEAVKFALGNRTCTAMSCKRRHCSDLRSTAVIEP